MKIAVSSTGKDLNASVDQRFGRAEYFLIVDPETMDFEVIENTQIVNVPQGAGIQSAKTVADKNVDVLLTGSCGPKAFNALNRVGIKVYTGAAGSIADAVNKFKNNELTQANGPDVEGHWV